MRVRLHHYPLFFDADGISAPLSPCNEELLLRGESVDVRRTRLAFQRFLKGKERNFGAAQVADALPQHQLAVMVHAGFDEIAFELVYYALRARQEATTGDEKRLPRSLRPK